MWHNLDWAEVVRKLGSDAEQGLSEPEVLVRQKKFGKNLLPEEKPLSKLKIFLEQFRSPLIYILVVAGFATLFFKEWADTIVIFGAVLLNTVVGYFQEKKASQALRALKKVVKIEAQVIRKGVELKLDSPDLVPGDIIVLTAGNKVPADGRVIGAHNLKINEAPLTGEWLSSQKTTDILPEEIPLADRDNMVYMGCMVEDGKGKVVVTSVGGKTEMGKVAELVKETPEGKTPLQKKIANFSRIVGVIIGFMALFIFIGGILAQKDVLEMFMISIAVAVAAIPEGLPVAMTVILALGMQRILKRKGLVKKLVAAETLGSTSVVCTDKTLTLTEGKMRVAETVTSGMKIKAEDKMEWAGLFKKEFDRDQILLITIATLTNEAFVENPQELYPLWITRGRPTDRALLLAGAEVGLKKPVLERVYSKIDEVPFNPQNKFIATLFEVTPRFHDRKTKVSLIRGPLITGTDRVLFVSGAPEKILELSNLDKKTFSKLNSQLEDLTRRGLRVVAGGYRKIKNQKSKIEKLENEVKELTFVGFIGLKDPLRPETKTAINLCKKAGMRPIIVTGDHLLTARAVGEELGLKTKKENIIEGKELDKMSEEDFSKRVKDIEIYARVEPGHKLRIIEAWQKKGEVVAMTGDGINDAPALKQADIGVALGSGTDVAKEVSDLVLLTDNFNIMVAAVEEGRAILDNIRKVITYLLSDSFTEVILIGGSMLICWLTHQPWILPITAVQILWVNLIEDGLPGVALAFEPKEKNVLQRKPEGKEAHLLTREMKVIIFIIGIFTALILLGLLWWLLKGNHDLQYIRTMIFGGLGINSLFYIFSCKNLRRNIWHINLFSNKFLVVGVVFGFLLLVLGIYLPVFQTLLKTVPLGFQSWLIILGLGVLNIILIEATKYYFIMKHQTEK